MQQKSLTLPTSSNEIVFIGKDGESTRLDLQKLLRADTGSEDAWINVTSILKEYDKRMSNWLRNKNIQSYLKEVESRIGEYPIRATSGKYHSGTWVHIIILEEFLRYSLPPESFFKLKLDGIFSIVEKEITPRHVYIVECHDETIKVGITEDIDRRFNQIENNSGKTIINKSWTEPIARAYEIEQQTLAYFDDYRINGEWLSGVEYNKVVEKMLHFSYNQYIEAPKLTSAN